LINYFVTDYAQVAVKIIWNIATLAIAIFMIPLYVGVATFFLKFANGENVETKVVFAQYKINIWEPIKAYLLVGLYILLGTICFIIPGIIMALKYSQVGFAFAENPESKYDEAMRRSADLMKGRKGEYFILGYPLSCGSYLCRLR